MTRTEYLKRLAFWNDAYNAQILADAKAHRDKSTEDLAADHGTSLTWMTRFLRKHGAQRKVGPREKTRKAIKAFKRKEKK